MASHCSSMSFLILLCCNLFTITSSSSSLHGPKTLVLPVKKALHSPRFQYIVTLKQRTPLVPVKLAVDLGLEHPWVVCDHGYVSSTYKPAHCGSYGCSLANKVFENCHDCYLGGTLNTPGCNNNTCVIDTSSSVGTRAITGELFRDIVTIKSTDGRVVSEPNFLSVCAMTGKLIGLASGVKGMAGFGVSKVSLPSQFSAAFGLDKKFAVCLSSSTKSNGVIFFGSGPYVFHPKIDVSKSLTYTPIYTRYVPGQYYLKVKSIKVNDKVVPSDLWQYLLTFNYNNIGTGGTTISTVFPYTVLEGLILNSVVDEFVKAIGNDVPRVAEVAPFEACFNSTNIARTRLGPAVPTIDFVFENNAVWRISGANSMVEVAKDVMCLAFVSESEDFPTNAAIDISGLQLEDNLVQFDLANKRLEFSSSLLSKQTSCSNFNFANHA